MSDIESRDSNPRAFRYCLCILAADSLLHQVTAMRDYPSLEDMLDRINLGGSFAIVDREISGGGPRFEPAGGEVVLVFSFAPIVAFAPVRASRHQRRGLGLREKRLTSQITLDELNELITVSFGAYAEQTPDALATVAYR